MFRAIGALFGCLFSLIGILILFGLVWWGVDFATNLSPGWTLFWSVFLTAAILEGS